MATQLVSSRCWGGVEWCSLGLCVAAMAILVAASSSAWAQEVEARKVPAYGPTEFDDEPVWETAIAAGLNEVMAVCRVGARGGGYVQVGYAIAVAVEQAPPGDNAPAGKPWRWVEEGTVPIDPYDPDDPDDLYPVTDPHDPSVAYDSVTGNFVLAGQRGGDHRPIVAMYDASTPQEEDPFQYGAGHGWNAPVLQNPPDNLNYLNGDKPWIVAGEVVPGNPARQEFYVVYRGAGATKYLRSVDGGQTWYFGDIELDSQPGFVQPAVYADGPLYVAYLYDNDLLYRFAQGQDPQTPGDPMTWRRLLDAWGQPLEVDLYTDDIKGYLPHVTNHDGVYMFPQLAADPSDEDVLYLVYHDVVDTSDPNDADVDVFLTKLRRNALTGTWAAELDRVRVNDENPQGVIADQFLPALTVDPYGRVHVIFYDDRHHRFQDDSTVQPKFDVYYAYSDTGGASFANERLFLDPELPPEEDPGVDFWHDVDENFEITDYIGITYRQSGVHTDIFTSFTGSSATDGDPNDPNDPYHHDDESLIWSSRILWSASP